MDIIQINKFSNLHSDKIIFCKTDFIFEEFKNIEKLDDAIKRKMKEEIGLSIENYSEIGIAETIFEDKHTINVCFKVDIEEVEIYLTDEHSKFEWFNLDGLPVNLNKILKSKIMETISVSEK